MESDGHGQKSVLLFLIEVTIIASHGIDIKELTMPL